MKQMIAHLRLNINVAHIEDDSFFTLTRSVFDGFGNKPLNALADDTMASQLHDAIKAMRGDHEIHPYQNPYP